MAVDAKLNLGCGPSAPRGWINIDRSPNLMLGRIPGAKSILHRLGVIADAHMTSWSKDIVRTDITKGLPYADASVTAIYSSHMLEHLYFNDAKGVLAECRRVLRPGAVLRLALPDGGQWAAAFLAGETGGTGDPPGLIFNRHLGAHPETAPQGLRRLTALAGGSSHRWQPTKDLVARMLADAGYTAVVERGYLEGDLPGLAEIESRPDSMFFEATI